jgi:arylsulfatase A-like enzyme
MSDDTIDRTKLPIRRPPFTGVLGNTLGDSQPGWEQIGHAQPPEGAPNVLVVLIDDAGFGNPGTFGGPIDTPNYDRVADEGLRYNRFHVTAMCSPTRAALLTGRNHHAVGMGGIPEFSGGFPGYSAMLPKDAAPFPKVMKENGYSTAAVGKWHLTPEKEQGPAGPFDHWPNAWGFDYYWGFLAPEAGQFDTMIAENQKFIGVQDGKDGKDFYFPEAMTDQAIDWLHGVRGHDAEKPWMLYYSTGCSHAPHHVAKEWSEKYKGHFDQGWDKLREETFERQKRLGVVPADAILTTRDEAMPAWDSLSETSKRLFARQMEVYAGYSENADYHVGRLLDSIEAMGELDDTIIVWIWGDNGASLEGTPTGTFNEGTMVNGLPLTDEEQMQLTLKWGGSGGVGHRDDVPALLHCLGVGWEHAVRVGQAGRLAPRRDAQPAGRPLPEAGQGRRRPAVAVHPRHRHRADDPRRGRDPSAQSCRWRRAAADDRDVVRRLSR